MAGNGVDIMDLPEEERIALVRKIIMEGREENRKVREAEDTASKEKYNKAREVANIAQQELRDTFKRLMASGELPKNRVYIKVKCDIYGYLDITLQSSVCRVFDSGEDESMSYFNGQKERILLQELYSGEQIDFMENVIRQYASGKSIGIRVLVIDGVARLSPSREG